jgi:hypothetical protein
MNKILNIKTFTKWHIVEYTMNHQIFNDLNHNIKLQNSYIYLI